MLLPVALANPVCLNSSRNIPRTHFCVNYFSSRADKGNTRAQTNPLQALVANMVPGIRSKKSLCRRQAAQSFYCAMHGCYHPPKNYPKSSSSNPRRHRICQCSATTHPKLLQYTRPYRGPPPTHPYTLPTAVHPSTLGAPGKLHGKNRVRYEFRTLLL